MAPTPEEIEKVKESLKPYRQTQLKLQKHRDELRTLHAQTVRALNELGGTKSLGADFLRAQCRMAELSLRQLEGYDLDQTIYAPPTEALSPAAEARHLEVTLALLDMETISMTALAAIVQADLPRAAAGEEPEGPFPEAWLTERALLARDAERRALWERFLGAFATFNEQKAAQLPSPTDEPGMERLTWLKRTVPALKGAMYRAHGVLRHLHTGEDVLKAVSAQLIADLKLGQKKGRTGRLKAPTKQPMRPAARPGGPMPPVPPAPRTGAGAITDRLLDIFKPPSK